MNYCRSSANAISTHDRELARSRESSRESFFAENPIRADATNGGKNGNSRELRYGCLEGTAMTINTRLTWKRGREVEILDGIPRARIYNEV